MLAEFVYTCMTVLVVALFVLGILSIIPIAYAVLETVYAALDEWKGRKKEEL